MTPIWDINLGGRAMPPLFEDRLVSLRLTDEEGVEADRVDIVVDDRDNFVQPPPHGTPINVSLGFRETGLSKLGSYVVDETSGNLNPDTLTIGAKAVDMGDPIRAPRTRSWEARTLKDITQTIAVEAGLQPVVGPSIAGKFYRFVDQTSESNLNLLTRLVRDLDGTAKIADGRLVVVKRGEGRLADGSIATPRKIRHPEIVRGNWNLKERVPYKQARVEWTDKFGAVVRQEVVGSGEPELKIRRVFATRSEAIDAATAALDKFQRAKGVCTLQLFSFFPDLFCRGADHT